ncbi:putative choline transport protein [Aspergillus lucknowensis]|uniref:Amino acid transporter n=1 Tax=Aspergillus lucknowensis TaxID=176173 RepID=A0ABR4M0E8_9EURO
MDTARLETALGHKSVLARNFDLLSLTSLGIVIASAWALMGATIATALQNGGPTVILYGLIVVSIFYTLISASLSELASSMPSAGGVYYWSTVLSYLNACGWLLSASSTSSILANEVLAMYILQHPNTEPHPWQVSILFQVLNWTCCGIVCFGNRSIPWINWIALALSHATVSDVWTDYQSNTGGWSDGIFLLTGLLNAAFAVGAPDCISHLSEEGFTTAFIYLVALFYSTTDIASILATTTTLSFFPTAAIYAQVTNSPAGATGPVAILFLATFPALIGSFVTGSRIWWSLARDNATPFSTTLTHVNPTYKTPLRAATYLGPILPNVCTLRRNFVPGPFCLGKRLGFFVNAAWDVYILVTVVFFCFPLVLAS